MNNPDIVARCRPYSMVSRSRMRSWVDDVAWVIAEGIPGDVVECGVWKGGCIFAAALVIARDDPGRVVHAFDTFSGMTSPGRDDVDRQGVHASKLMHLENVRACSGIAEFYQNREKIGLQPESIKVVAGDLRQTTKVRIPGSIAALRLDMDWYDLTACALDILAPLVSPGGVIHIDDYGWWRGARKAVDEWLGETNREIEWIDETGIRIRL